MFSPVAYVPWHLGISIRWVSDQAALFLRGLNSWQLRLLILAPEHQPLPLGAPCLEVHHAALNGLNPGILSGCLLLIDIVRADPPLLILNLGLSLIVNPMTVPRGTSVL
jgi:hypothetical protein